ncbi:MAG: phosphoenolpyruvate--protein phosphotransferase [Proteobacteria bacterium]|nr:phosphoenolpyruvate--protein phosphotransferase [Pseudomonadota bacterium]
MSAAQAATVSHHLLRRLREIVSQSTLSAQEKLDHIVRIIAQEYGADMCSVYIMRAGAALELFATHGLRPQAVHRTFIKIGKGVVGDVVENARPLVLSDIRLHPRFYLDPQMGEEELQSFMGTPLSRGGRVLGALVVQDKRKRLYQNEDVETLQTVAMVLAEMIVAGELVKPDELLFSNSDGPTPTVLKGVVLNAGLALGRAVLHHPFVPVKRLINDDAERELHRLYEAIAKMRASLRVMFAESDSLGTTESKEVLETYQMFAQDRGWLNRIRKGIEGGLTAEAAVQKTLSDLRFRIGQSHDAYFRERLWDFEDLTNRLLQQLVGNDNAPIKNADEGVIVVARTLGPAELLDYEKHHVVGLILEEGLHNAHVSIVARALRIPVISRTNQALTKVESGDLILMDASKGEVILSPSEEQIELHSARQRKQEERRTFARKEADLPIVTKDGVPIQLSLNAGSLLDLESLKEAHLASVGLYRTEIPFMLESSFPDVEAQVRLYQDIFQAAGDSVITFRTLDIGGDKLLPYLRAPEDSNPLLGWRAIRIGLDRPIILRQQIRALLQASNGRPFRLMFPMLSSLDEFLSAKAIFMNEKERALSQGHTLSDTLQVGAMVEVPSFAWSLPDGFGQMDFISVGSNDLFQFFFASDRTNPNMIGRYDNLSRSFLTLLKRIFSYCDEAGLPYSLCGEMAGKPLEALVLMAMGLRHFSVSPHALDPIKRMIRSTSLEKLSQYVTYLLANNVSNLRHTVHAFALDHGILLEEY